jgi:hypothetical protein
MLKKIFSVSYCSNIIPQLVIDKKIQNNNDNYYYSTIYLCIKEYKDESYKFIPYSKDSNYDLICKDTIILPVCKFVPYYFHNYILKYKLSNIKNKK